MNTIMTCVVGGETILIDLDTEIEEEGVRNHERWRASTYTEKEPDTLAWIDTFFQPGDVIYDVGANIGQYSLYAALKLKKQATVLAFEPEALNFAKLNKNIVLNDLIGTVIPYCLAVTDHMAFDRFYAKTFAPGAALHALGRPITQGGKPFPPQNQQGILAVSLDDLTGRLSAPFPTHIKVDVDGIEDLILTGAEQTLADPRLKSVLIEVFMHKNIASKIKDVFLGKGFELHNADVIDYTPGIVQNLIFKKE